MFCYFSNLRRLVHAMILKQPPREWIGTFRFVYILVLHKSSIAYNLQFACWVIEKLRRLDVLNSP